MRTHLTYANVVSSICLFVVLGGTSWAVATGSIGSREIKNNSVRSKDVRNNDLTGRDVKDSSLRAGDFRLGDLPAGPPGVAGPRGSAGAPGSALAFAHVRNDGTLDTARSKNVVDVRPPCGAPCTLPPPAAASQSQCFKLSVTPRNAVASYQSGTAGSISTVAIDLDVATGATNTCPPGYGSARTFTSAVDNPSTGQPAGFWIAFN